LFVVGPIAPIFLEGAIGPMREHEPQYQLRLSLILKKLSIIFLPVGFCSLAWEKKREEEQFINFS